MKTVYVYAPYGHFFDNFCSDAYLAAMEKGFEVKLFTEIEEVPRNINVMVVGTVEDTQKWFDCKLPSIDVHNDDPCFWSNLLKLRNISRGFKKDITRFPVFVKPLDDIKSFTGFVASNKQELDIISDDIELSIQGYIEIESEYRAYINNGRLVGLKHYSGDPFLAPDKDVFDTILKLANMNLTEKSFTLDIGVNYESTFLIEINDAWAIANYGLTPQKYFHFLCDRWNQLIEKYFIKNEE